jgi:hypothetical protein
MNLNFESAYSLTNDSYIPASSAIPSWIAYDGTVPISSIYYASNNFTGVFTVVELEGGSLALSGDFSVGLYDGGSVSQTGVVPAGTESLQFEASSVINLKVTLGGQILSYSALSQGPNYTVYGANIPAAMDGQSEDLTFSAESVTPGDLLDNIAFSSMSIPEPPEYALVCLGAILFVVRCRKYRRVRC